MTTNLGKSVDLKRLRGFYSKNQAGRDVLDHLASRERSWRATTVDRIHANVTGGGGGAISRSQIIDVFRELEACGCGVFKAGRRGHPSRFEWRAHMVSVGQAAAGEIDDIEPVTAADADDEEGFQTLAHSFRLRMDSTVTFELPANLTASEAARLSDFIKTLPMTK